MSLEVILAIDQGTTGSRAILYNTRGGVVSTAYQEFRQYYPFPGWVEHDPIEIWHSVRSVMARAIRNISYRVPRISALSITNQRETVIVWDRRTGKPCTRAIVWQDRRTAPYCVQLQRRYGDPWIREKTGLVWDAYFSATKLHWIFEKYPSLRTRAQRGEVLSGTVDTWLLWNLTDGRVHATDYTNASRTMLFHIAEKTWDEQLLRIFKIPRATLPEPKMSCAEFGRTRGVKEIHDGIPIHSIIGDQQAALYGQSCYQAGQTKNTYGTGCFMVVNLGKKYPKPVHGLITTLACDKNGHPTYALEGAVFIAGAAIQWLRDGLGFFKKASETERCIRHLKDSGGVVVIPAFVGLGSPHWNSEIRGQILGITRGTTRAHIIRATLESIAHQTADVMEIVKQKAGRSITELRVDGGMVNNNFLMQFQSDLLHIPVLVTDRTEATAWGAAKLAGRKIKFFSNEKEIENLRAYHRYMPRMTFRQVKLWRGVWKKNLAQALSGTLPNKKS